MIGAAEISGGLAILVFIGLFVGLIVLLVVIWLLNGVLTPLRKVLADLEDAKTVPMLERGVPGTEQLGQTRRLAESVPPLALAYLQKLSLSPAPAPPPPAEPFIGSAPAEAPADANLPAWKRYRG